MILVGYWFFWLSGSMVLSFVFSFQFSVFSFQFLVFGFGFWTIFDSSIYSGWFACPCCVKALLSSSSPVLKQHHQPVPGSAILDKVSKNKVKTTFSLCLIDAKKMCIFASKIFLIIINIFSLKVFHVGHKYILKFDFWKSLLFIHTV